MMINYTETKPTLPNNTWLENASRLPGEILRYADTTLVAESEEELNSLLLKGKRRVKKLA